MMMTLDGSETLNGRATNKTLKRSEQRKGQNTTKTLKQSETLKEQGTKKTLNRSGLVSTNVTLFMLKQEKEFRAAWSDVKTASQVLNNKKAVKD
eukprot:Em0007g4a